MKKQLTNLIRIFMALAFVAAMAAALPRPVQAASQWFDILTVQPDQWIKVRAHSFPANQIFTVRMDASGNQGINGIYVTQTNTGAGGDFEETYTIPAELKGVKTITVRMESAAGLYSYNWFNNASATTTIPTTGYTYVAPNLSISAVDAGNKATVKVSGFPAGQYFTVRVGPFWTFSRSYSVVDTVYSGSGGSFSFNIDIPDNVVYGDWVAVRMDSPQKYYAYNAFKNVDSGTVSSNPAGPTVTNACSIVSTMPDVKIAKGASFDAVWKIRNVSGKTWDMTAVDYKYVSGREMQVGADRFDMTENVKDDNTVKIIVDMVAPNKAGTFTTHWALVQGKTTLCELPLTITVK